jgi:adenylate cyclase
MAVDENPTPEAIRLELDRILKSPQFKGSDKQRAFLRFIVDEVLAGRSSQLKGYTIAVAVYGRNENFDPQVDPIVRVEARRLRRVLEHYYLTAGGNDPVRIEIPKGGYAPSFHMVQTQPCGGNTLNAQPDPGELHPGPSIAVIPLTNLTGDEAQDYFTDGMTEELITELARFQEFQVIASQSTMHFKGENFNTKEVGRDLGVRFLLAGSVRMESKELKVSIRLIDTSTTTQIWAESYRRELTAANLIAIQEEISHSIVGRIADQYGLIIRRLSRESRKKAPADMKAYDAVLRFYHYETVLTLGSFQQALTALERVIEIEPEYGLAWAMLGHLHADNYALGFCEIDSPLDKALTFALKGVALAPDNQFAQDALTLVHFHRGDKASFQKHAEKTIALNPNAPHTVGVAGWHMALIGNWERGLSLLKKGIRLNPYHPSWFHLVPYMNYYRRGDYENAYAEALKFNYPDFFWDPLLRAAALGQIGGAREARIAVAELLKLVPDFAARARQMIGYYVKVNDLVDMVLEGLRKAGLSDLE